MARRKLLDTLEEDNTGLKENIKSKLDNHVSITQFKNSPYKIESGENKTLEAMITYEELCNRCALNPALLILNYPVKKVFSAIAKSISVRSFEEEEVLHYVKESCKSLPDFNYYINEIGLSWSEEKQELCARTCDGYMSTPKVKYGQLIKVRGIICDLLNIEINAIKINPLLHPYPETDPIEYCQGHWRRELLEMYEMEANPHITEAIRLVDNMSGESKVVSGISENFRVRD